MRINIQIGNRQDGRSALVRGDCVEWQAEDGLLRDGEFRHEPSLGIAYVRMSRTISSYVPMCKLRKVDPSAC